MTPTLPYMDHPATYEPCPPGTVLTIVRDAKLDEVWQEYNHELPPYVHIQQLPLSLHAWAKAEEYEGKWVIHPNLLSQDEADERQWLMGYGWRNWLSRHQLQVGYETMEQALMELQAAIDAHPPVFDDIGMDITVKNESPA